MHVRANCSWSVCFIPDNNLAMSSSSCVRVLDHVRARRATVNVTCVTRSVHIHMLAQTATTSINAPHITVYTCVCMYRHICTHMCMCGCACIQFCNGDVYLDVDLDVDGDVDADADADADADLYVYYMCMKRLRQCGHSTHSQLTVNSQSTQQSTHSKLM